MPVEWGRVWERREEAVWDHDRKSFQEPHRETMRKEDSNTF